MLYSSIDFDNLIAYKTSQFLHEAQQHRLARAARQAPARSYPTSVDAFLDRLGAVLVDAGLELQRRAGRCISGDEYARQLR